VHDGIQSLVAHWFTVQSQWYTIKYVEWFIFAQTVTAENSRISRPCRHTHIHVAL